MEDVTQNGKSNTDSKPDEEAAPQTTAQSSEGGHTPDPDPTGASLPLDPESTVVPRPLSRPGKLRGFEFWRETLNSARYVVAPMVDQSELAWRVLSRRHGAELCYTPMFHAMTFSRDAWYRRENLHTDQSDEPLIVQFCANDPETILAAAKHTESQCVAVDINLGCPQSIAKRGHYGAFLMSEWDLITKMVEILDVNLSVPVTCKIRIFPTVEETCKYARMLEAAGCSLLTVHGRRREQKGIYTGLADWAHIKAVKEYVSIPVFANGNIQYLSDVKKCISDTGVDGVMTAEGNLHNPALFDGVNPPAWEMSDEYLELVHQFPCPLSYVRGHLFKMWYHTFQIERFFSFREMLAKARSVDDCREAMKLLKEKCLEDQSAGLIDLTSNNLPHWCCQPFVRPNPDRSEGGTDTPKQVKRRREKESREVVDEEGNTFTLSKSKFKKFHKVQKKQVERNFRKFEKCVGCGNPKGQRCSWERCKACCKMKCYKEILDCIGHRYQFLTRAKNKQQTNNTTTTNTTTTNTTTTNTTNTNTTTNTTTNTSPTGNINNTPLNTDTHTAS